jgi:hypothetical protein
MTEMAWSRSLEVPALDLAPLREVFEREFLLLSLSCSFWFLDSPPLQLRYVTVSSSRFCASRLCYVLTPLKLPPCEVGVT